LKKGTLEVVDRSIIIGGKRQYIGAAPFPVTPIKGDRWVEFDNADNFIETWIYSGVFWISEEVRNFGYNSNTTALNATLNTTVHPLTTNFKLLLVNIVIAAIQNTTASGTNNINVAVTQINNGTSTVLFNLNTFTNLALVANNWIRAIVPINIVVDVSTGIPLAIALVETRTGTPTKNLSYFVQTKKIRL
jgi:hypothetical protein